MTLGYILKEFGGLLRDAALCGIFAALATMPIVTIMNWRDAESYNSLLWDVNTSAMFALFWTPVLIILAGTGKFVWECLKLALLSR